MNPASAASLARPDRWRLELVALAIAAFLIRARYFGDPLIDPDEAFYLLTGDRMLHGAVPYLDIWDRKPVGLFLLYAAMRAIGGAGVLGYQVVAGIFAAATSVVIAVIARRIAPPGAALVAGLLYIPALAMAGGQGGQAPVFFNLPMALAVLLTLGAAGRSPASIRGRGIAAMALVGVAIQIKYSVVFEGIFLGLALCWTAWRADPRPAPRLIDAALWAGVALVPTLAAFLTYAAIGEAQAFLYANFISIGERGPYGHALRDLWRAFARLIPILIPLAATALIPRAWRSWHCDAAARRAHRFVLGWAGAALAGYAVMGSYFNHYALPLLVPLAILASPAFAIRRWRIGVSLAVAALGFLFARYALDAEARTINRGGAAYAQQITDTIRPLLRGGNLYVFYGEPIFYLTTGSSLPSRWAFPYHLSLTREAPALGVNAAAEVTRILDTRPAVILDRDIIDDEINPVTRAILNQRLKRDYRLAAAFKRTYYTDRIWALRR